VRVRVRVRVRVGEKVRVTVRVTVRVRVSARARLRSYDHAPHDEHLRLNEPTSKVYPHARRLCCGERITPELCSTRTIHMQRRSVAWGGMAPPCPCMCCCYCACAAAFSGMWWHGRKRGIKNMHNTVSGMGWHGRQSSASGAAAHAQPSAIGGMGWHMAHNTRTRARTSAHVQRRSVAWGARVAWPPVLS
jgi:hypothetical protein